MRVSVPAPIRNTLASAVVMGLVISAQAAKALVASHPESLRAPLRRRRRRALRNAREKAGKSVAIVRHLFAGPGIEALFQLFTMVDPELHIHRQGTLQVFR